MRSRHAQGLRVERKVGIQRRARFSDLRLAKRSVGKLCRTSTVFSRMAGVVDDKKTGGRVMRAAACAAPALGVRPRLLRHHFRPAAKGLRVRCRRRRPTGGLSCSFGPTNRNGRRQEKTVAGVSDHEPGTARKGCLRFLAAASARTGPHHHPARQRDARVCCAQKSQGWLRVRPRPTQPKGSYFSRSRTRRVCHFCAKKKREDFRVFSARVCTSLRS